MTDNTIVKYRCVHSLFLSSTSPIKFSHNGQEFDAEGNKPNESAKEQINGMCEETVLLIRPFVDPLIWLVSAAPRRLFVLARLGLGR